MICFSSLWWIEEHLWRSWGQCGRLSWPHQKTFQHGCSWSVIWYQFYKIFTTDCSKEFYKTRKLQLKAQSKRYYRQCHGWMEGWESWTSYSPPLLQCVCNKLQDRIQLKFSRARHNVLFILSVIHQPTSWLASRQLTRCFMISNQLGASLLVTSYCFLCSQLGVFQLVNHPPLVKIIVPTGRLLHNDLV